MSPALGPVGGPVTEQWRALTAHLAPLRSTEPADRVIREDVDRLLAIAFTPERGDHQQRDEDAAGDTTYVDVGSR